MPNTIFCQSRVGLAIQKIISKALPRPGNSKDFFSDITHPGGCRYVPTCKPMLVSSGIQFVRQGIVMMTRKPQCLPEPTVSTGGVQHG